MRASGSPANALRTSSRVTHIAASISLASSVSARSGTLAIQPIINCEGNGHGWLAT